MLFKTSISFIDHLQEVLGTILTASTLVVPPFNLLKENIFSVLHFLEVGLKFHLPFIVILLLKVNTITTIFQHYNEFIC